MRLGAIQQDVISFLTQCGENGDYLGCGTRAKELRGYDLEQVERAVAGLLRIGIIRKEGIRYIQVKNDTHQS